MGLDLGWPSSQELDYMVGPFIEYRSEVKEVKRALLGAGIDLDLYEIRILGVMIRPRPRGFKFYTPKSSELLEAAKAATEALGLDNRQYPSGRFVSAMSKGPSFRAPGFGESLHLVVGLNGYCDAHLDTHGLVSDIGSGDRNSYDPMGALSHGYWDLLSDTVPGLFGTLGDRGAVGPWAAPVKRLDSDGTLFTIGVTGYW